MIGVFIAESLNGDFSEAISAMDKATQEWEAKAARGECGWVCADCCMTFPEGMPDACGHGQQWCTEIIQRDKKAASPAASHDTLKGETK